MNGNRATTLRRVGLVVAIASSSVGTTARHAFAQSAPAQTEADSSLGTQRTLALVAGAAGVVGIGMGTVFGVLSMAKKSDADALCDANNVCDDPGVDLRSDAISAGNISTISFLAGGVLAATGVVLWLTAPSPKSGPRAGLAPRWGGIGLRLELP